MTERIKSLGGAVRPKEVQPLDNGHHFNVGDGIHLNVSQRDAATGYARNLNEALTAAVEDSDARNHYVDNVIERIDAAKKSGDDLYERGIKAQIDTELRDAYLSNQDDLEACKTAFEGIAKKYGDTGLFQTREHELKQFISERTNGYLMPLVASTHRKQNQRFEQVCKQELGNELSRLKVAYEGINDSDKLIAENSATNFAESLARLDEITHRTDYDGRPVFDALGIKEIRGTIGNVLAQSYAKDHYDQLPNFADKARFIHEIETGFHKAELTHLDGAHNDVLNAQIDFMGISEGARNRIVRELSTKYKQECNAFDKAAKEAHAADVANGKKIKEPKNPDYRQCVAEYYDQLCDNVMAPILISQSEDKYAKLLTLHDQFIQTFNVIPERMTNHLSNFLKHGDPNMFGTACEIANKVRESEEPVFIADKSFYKNFSYAFMGYHLLHSGLPLQQAYDVVKTAQAMTPQQRSELDTDFSNFLQENPHFISEKITKPLFKVSWWKSGKNPSDFEVFGEMKQQAKTLVRSFYVLTGDMDSAVNATREVLKDKWQLSSINGTREIMADPPEKFYGTKVVDSAEMRRRVLEFLKNNYKLEDESIDTARVCFDEATEKQIRGGSSSPTYALQLKNEFGFYEDFIDAETFQKIRIGANLWRTEGDEKATGIYDVKQVLKTTQQARQLLETESAIHATRKYVDAFTMDALKKKFEKGFNNAGHTENIQ